MNTGAANRLSHSTEWLADGSVDSVRDTLLEAVRRRGGRVEDLQPGGFEACLGSRLAARLGGVLLKASRERLPMRVRLVFTATQDEAVRVELKVEDNEGWNAVSLAWRERPYLDAMRDLAVDLAASTSGGHAEANRP